jgi:hypothetical protein
MQCREAPSDVSLEQDSAGAAWEGQLGRPLLNNLLSSRIFSR